eukprot:TRINITY_DN1790_c0_g1_i3.p2 TRINITY_DN1790_c0_g1~~TRINITY_DN1790_c0_g1_i3.p2  ORF type:complete len:100 (+),score=13.62 TRINITY_DN1790_c0_g1_i3:427-726(+)
MLASTSARRLSVMLCSFFPKSPFAMTDTCVRSQKGLLLDCLHPHRNRFSERSATKRTGFIPCVCLCEPSQKGSFFVSPHAHHEYRLPSSSATCLVGGWH